MIGGFNCPITVSDYSKLSDYIVPVQLYRMIRDAPIIFEELVIIISRVINLNFLTYRLTVGIFF